MEFVRYGYALPYPSPLRRNAAIHAAESRFGGQAGDIVSLVLRRAHGGDPVCLRLCLERALPAGRIPPAVDLAPGYDPANLNRAFHAIGDALDDGTINVRQAARVLDALGGPSDRRFAPSGAGSMRAREDVKQVRAMAEIEAGLAQSLADHFITVAPRGPGGVLEHHQTHGPRISSAPFRFARLPDQRCTAARCTASGTRPSGRGCAASGEHTEETP